MVRLAWDERDVHSGWILVVGASAVLAAALAVFGLPPVPIHSPLHFVGIMDPLCGMTRATRLFARGDPSDAWRYNPGSFLLAAAAGAIVTRALGGWATGRWARLVVDGRTLLIAGVVLLVLLEVNQQVHASLLR